MNFDVNIRYLKEEIEETAKKFLGRVFSGSDEERQRKVDILWSSIEQSPVAAVQRRNSHAKSYINAKNEVMRSLKQHMKDNPDSQRIFEIHHSKEQLDSGLIDEAKLLDHARNHGIKHIKTKKGGIILRYVTDVKKDPRIGRSFDPRRHGSEFSHLHPSGNWDRHVEEATKKYTDEIGARAKAGPLFAKSDSEIKQEVRKKLEDDKILFDDAKSIHDDEQRGFIEQHNKRKNSALEDHVHRIITHIEKFGSHNRVKERKGKQFKLSAADIRHDELKKKYDLFKLSDKHARIRIQKLHPDDENIRRLGDFIGGALNPRYAVRDTDPVSRKLGNYIANRLDSAVKAFSADLGPRSDPSAPAEDMASEHAPR